MKKVCPFSWGRPAMKYLTAEQKATDDRYRYA